MKKVFAILSLLAVLSSASAQEDSCSLDSTKCSKSKMYIGGDWSFEKLVYSNDSVSTTNSPIFIDMDLDCIPEILTIGISQDGAGPFILIMDSRTGTTKRRIYYPGYGLEAKLAAADVDNDGYPEIFLANPRLAPNENQKILCYNYDGSLKWISNETYGPDRFVRQGSPGLADFNQDGIAEVYVGNRIFNAQTGVLLVQGGNNGIGTRWSTSCAGQFDMDQTDLELAAGYSIYKINIINTSGEAGNSMIANNILIANQLRDGMTSIGDINNDGVSDVLVCTEKQGGFVWLYSYTLANGFAELVAQIQIPGPFANGVAGFSYMGIPIAADIDNNGSTEIVITKPNHLLCFEFDGTSSFDLLWDIPTSDDSGTTAAALFDLNGNDTLEVIYRDETYIKIIVNNNGNPLVVAQSLCSSLTFTEGPLVGNLLGDGSTQICIHCGDKNPSRGNISIFGPSNSLRPWAPSRNIWNQYNYHVLNINDDLTVPRVLLNNATYENGLYNNFMTQQSLLDTNGFYRQRAASLFCDIDCINYDIRTDSYSVVFNLFNLSDASLTARSGLSVSFYNGDPRSGGTLIGTYLSNQDIPPGGSLLNLTYTFSFPGLTELFMVINSDKSNFISIDEDEFDILECNYLDNFSSSQSLPIVEFFLDSICDGEGYTFLDTVVNDEGIYYRKIYKQNGCDSIVAQLELKVNESIWVNTVQTTCDSFLWRGELYTNSGSYSKTVGGNEDCDSTFTLDLTILKSTTEDMSRTACDFFNWNGDSLTRSGNYNFLTKNSEGCDSTVYLELTVNTSNIDSVYHRACQKYTWHSETYNESGFYTLDTVNQFGCDSTVVLNLEILDTVFSSEAINICEGDSVLVFGEYISRTAKVQQLFSSSLDCDSVHVVDVVVDDVFRENLSKTICEGDSIFVVDRWLDSTGMYTISKTNVNDCDSLFEIDIQVLSAQYLYDTIQICEGDSIMVFDTLVSKVSDISRSFMGSNGCDSTVIIHISIKNSGPGSIEEIICPGDSILLKGRWFNEPGSYTLVKKNMTDCDSVFQVLIREFVVENGFDTVKLCQGDTVNVYGQLISSQGDVKKTFQNSNGCDSVSNIYINVIQPILETIIFMICPDDSININGNWISKDSTFVELFVAKNGCDSLATFTVEIPEDPGPPTFEIDCEKMQIIARIEADSNWDIEWDNGDRGNQTTYSQQTMATVTLTTDPNCVKEYTSVLPDIPNLGNIDLPGDTTLAPGSSLQINLNIDSNDWEVVWKPADIIDCDTCTQVTITSSETKMITIIMVHKSGCIIEHTFLVSVNDNIFIPNVFTPNGDGINDVFRAFFTENITIIYCQIFDRWGELVYNSSLDDNFVWGGNFNGKKAPSAVYTYKIEYQVGQGEKRLKSGDVTLMR